MLQGELESHLGYKNNALRSNKDNARNGYISKQQKMNMERFKQMFQEIEKEILSHR